MSGNRGRHACPIARRVRGVPLYNEIQATTTFASLAVFFFLVFTEVAGSDRKPSARDDAGPQPSATWRPPPMRTPLPGMGDSCAPRSVIGMICNIISARS